MNINACEMTVAVDAWTQLPEFAGVERLRYSTVDGGEDWALAWPGTLNAWVVAIHGHGSTGDQLFTRIDVRDRWLQEYRRLGLGVLSPNLRGNAWMCPEAAADLHRVLAWARTHYAIAATCFLSGSMGGTSNLIYGILHPEDVTLMAAQCPATDIASYTDWCYSHPGGVIDEIYQAIVGAYGGTPSMEPEKYAHHSALAHAERLTMPLLVGHGDADALIPVEQARRLADAMQQHPRFTYVEIAGGDHDAPLFGCDMIGWLEDRLREL